VKPNFATHKYTTGPTSVDHLVGGLL
jgi:hypothetical protein